MIALHYPKQTTDACKLAIQELLEYIPALTEYKHESRGIKCEKVTFDIKSSSIYEALMVVIDYGYYGDLNAIDPIANHNDISTEEVPFYDLSSDIDELKMYQEVNGDGPEYLDYLFNKFNSRFKVDHFRGVLADIYHLHHKFERTLDVDGVTIRDVAILAEMSEKGVRNLMYSDNPPPFKKITDGNPTIFDAQSVYDWLVKRPVFKPSRHIPDEEKITDINEISKNGKMLVPVAKDGTWFCHELCRMAKGFYVGPKGEQECIPDIVDALKRLKQLNSPKWRRKNDKGNFGIVTGIDWQWVNEKDVLPPEGVES